MWRIVAFGLFAMSSAALAQQVQAPQILSAAERCGQIVGALAANNATLGQKYDELAQQMNATAAQLAKAQDRIKELEAKYEPKAK